LIACLSYGYSILPARANFKQAGQACEIGIECESASAVGDVEAKLLADLPHF
jgi:hypothetical protein